MPNTTYMALETSIEQSLITWLQATATHGISLSAFNIRKAEEDATDALTLPAIIVKATREAEDPAPGTGCWRCNVEVQMLVQADDTAEATMKSHWHNLMYVLMWDDLKARLSDYEGLLIHGVVREAGTRRDVDDRHWLNSYNFTVWAISQD